MPKVSSCCDLHFLSWNFDQRHTQALTKLGFMLTNTQEENVLVMKRKSSLRERRGMEIVI
jgi:hypothetical protein